MEAGRIIAGRFEVERRVGGGGMGTVCRARDALTGAHVALKFMKHPGEGLADRFAREGRILAELQHPGVVGYIAHGATQDGELYLAMEWLDGEDLAKRLSRKGLTLEETMYLARRIAGVLAQAHTRGVVHRDIKPSNIFLPSDDVRDAKLLDFGIVRWESAPGPETGIGVRIGTLGYMAPEQARGDATIDARADIFSLGCVMWECIAGRAAFDGEHEVAVLAKTLLEEPPALSSLRPFVHFEIESLIMRMLAKDRAGRPADGGVLLRDLEALGNVAGSAPPPQPYRRKALTETERRLLAVILAGRVDEHGPGKGTSMPTVLLRSQRSEDEAVRAAAKAFGAMVERLQNGTFVLTLLGRGAATDQAVHAARCALAIRAILPADRPVALATGRGLMDERMPAGEVIDRAVETLQRSQDTVGIRVDDTTAGLLDRRFEIVMDEDGGPRLIVERESHAEGRTLLGKPSPCVGRDRELSFLLSTYADCVDDETGRAVLLVAPAGAGKSRVLRELGVRLEGTSVPPEIWSTRGDPVIAGSPFSLVGAALRHAFAIRDGEPENYRREKIRKRVLTQAAGEDGERIAEFLGEIMHCTFPDTNRPELAAARLDAVVRGDQMRRAFDDFMRIVTSYRPVVLVIDDLQWGDLPSVQMIDAALRNAGRERLLVIAAGRPELYDQFPRIWSERDLQELRLGPLGRRAAETLVKTALGEDAPERALANIVERAQGNPFYIEELVRAHARGEGDSLPETVIAMVQARLEALEEDARRVLRAASIYGNAFWPSGIAALLGDTMRKAQIQEWLDELAVRELLSRRTAGRFHGEIEYGFHQDTIRGAAYAMLTERDAEIGHRLAAEWLESVGETDPAVLAAHYEAGEEPSRAIGYYRRAAENALVGNDLAAVLTRADRGVACGASGEDLGRFRLLAAEAHRWRGEFEEAARRAGDARTAFAPGSALWYRAVGEEAAALAQLARVEPLLLLCEITLRTSPEAGAQSAAVVAWARLAMHLMQHGRTAEVRHLFTELDRPSREPRTKLASARHHQARAVEAQFLGDPILYLSATAAATEDFEHGGDLRSAAMMRMNLGYAYQQVGLYEEAERSLREAQVTTHRMGLANISAVAKHNLGLVVARVGRVDEGRALEKEALRAVVAQGDRRIEAAARIYLSHIELIAGDSGAADREARAALQITHGTQGLYPLAMAHLARASVRLGRLQQGLVTAEEAMRKVDQAEEGGAIVRLAFAEALVASRDPRATAAIEDACSRIETHALKIPDDRAQKAFLAIPEHAETFALRDRRGLATLPPPPGS